DGYRRFLDDPKKTPGANLLHYALGPASEQTREFILGAGKAIEEGRSIGSGGAQRLIYGPALRDDVYPKGKVGYELRQYSSSRRAMLAGTWELTQILVDNRIGDFAGYEDVPMINPELAYFLTDSGLEPAQVRGYVLDIESHLKSKSSFLFTGGASFGERFL